MTKGQTKHIQIALLLFAFTSMVFGCIRGEHQVVLSKAVKLCLECVGIG